MGDTYRFHEFDLPVHLVHLTGGPPEEFQAGSDFHLAAIRKFIGISPDDHFLEIGCGIGRDAIPLTKILSPKGSYTGVDIIRPSIEFCQSAITPLYPRFRFIHLDVKDQLHNPNGVSRMVDHQLSIANGTIDKVIAWSVFTHMWEHDIRHYLREFFRVLKPGGMVYATCFVVDDAIAARARETNLTRWGITFEHKINDHCYISDPNYPLGSIGYTKSSIDQMIADCGFEKPREFARGAWSGAYSASEAEDGQDGLILRKPNI